MRHYHVLRSEWSPSIGLRQTRVTRESVRAKRSLEVLADAVGEHMQHMARGGGWIDYRDLRLHECLTFLCPRPWDHVVALWWADDPSRITTFRLEPVDGRT